VRREQTLRKRSRTLQLLPRCLTGWLNRRRQARYNALQRQVAGALRDAIKQHGPITNALISSAAKRIASQLLSGHPRIAHALLTEQAWLIAQPTPLTHDLHLFGTNEEYAQWLFTLAVTNFSFWLDDPAGRWLWTDPETGEICSGARAHGAAWRYWLTQNVPLTDASWLAQLTPAQLAQLLTGLS
jgi:Potential Queuosine, Q, salvage protein family